jgi:hypothetical protein
MHSATDRAASTSKEPKTGSSARTIPLTGHTTTMLKAMRVGTRCVMSEIGIDMGDPYILGTQVPDAVPINPRSSARTSAPSAR